MAEGIERMEPGKYLIRFTYTTPEGKRKDVRRRVRADSMREARRKREDLRDRLQSPPRPDGGVTLAAFIESWIKGNATRWKSSTAYHYAKLGAIVAADLGHLPLDHVTREVIQGWRDSMTGDVSNTTVNNRLRTLRAILSEAELQGRIRAPLFKRLALKEKRKPKVFTPDDVNRFVDVCRVQAPDWYPLTLALARTGLRLGEAVALTWGQVDLDRGAITVDRNWYRGRVQMGTKGGRDREVPTTPDLQAFLEGRREDAHDALVLPAPRTGRYLTTSPTSKAYGPLSEAAELPHKAGPHKFRHSLNNAVRRVAGEVVAAAILGHDTGSNMTAHYSAPTLDEKREAVARAFGLWQ